VGTPRAARLTSRWPTLLALLALAVWGLVVLGPALDAQFVLVDDHEILSLVPPVGAPPGTRPAIDVRGRVLVADPAAGRFRPLFWAARLGEVAVFGDDAHAWHVTGLIQGLVAAGLLVGAARALGASGVEAGLLGAWLLAAPGVSSIWVRLGTNETLAMAFFSLSLLGAARAARGHARFGWGWDMLFVLGAAGSFLSKEAFALTAVALAGLRSLAGGWPDGGWPDGGWPDGGWPDGGWRRGWRMVPLSAWLVLGLGGLMLVGVVLVGAAAGPLSYGGRHLTLPDLAGYARTVVQNAAILGFVGLPWLVLLAAWPRRACALAGRERGHVLGATLVMLVLVGPQLVLYSQQGVFEGKYEVPAAVAVAGWSLLGLGWLRRHAAGRRYRAAIASCSVVLVAFGFSTWTYAMAYTADSVQVRRLVDEIAARAPPGSVAGIAADPARQYEPITSLADHLAHAGRADLHVEVLPLAPAADRPYNAVETADAQALLASPFGQPPLQQSGCSGLAVLVVLGDEAATRAALPCLDQGYQRREFSARVLLWGGDGVSLRPRLPGWTSVGYVLLEAER